MKSLRIFEGAALAALGLVFVVGCQKADDANYREYSGLDNGGIKEMRLEKPLSTDAEAAAPAQPAIAEKPGQSPIAQASFVRPDLNQTKPLSVNAPKPGVRSRPGDIVLAQSSGPPREIKLLIPEKRFAKASADGTLRVTFDDLDLLKVLNMEPVPLDAMDHFPAWLKALEGQRIRIRGFMMPAYQDTGLRGFELARDNEICCFGRDPKVYDLIVVRMQEGLTANYLPQTPFDVEGTLHFMPPEPGDKLLFRLYEIRDAKVITGRSR